MSALTDDPDYRAFCEERLQNPYPLFHRLRAEDPVHWCEPMKLWLVTRYEDVLAGLRDPRLSSNRTAMYVQALPPEIKQRVQPLLDHVAKWIQLTDEPAHARLRKLVSMAFTPKMIGLLRPRIENLVAGLLQQGEPNKPYDIIETFCSPLPATVICEILGIPPAERDRFFSAIKQVMKFSTRGGPALKDTAEPALAALNQLISMFERLVQARRLAPQDDLLSALVSAEADGDHLSNEELYAMCVFLFMAGHETTASGIASGILALAQHPDQFTALKANLDGLVGGAVEETLRYEAPVTRAVRQAREDMAISEKRISSGQLVVLLLGAANRDPAQFFEPDRFDITRQPNRHLGFGIGPHFCLGGPLARLEMEVAFRTLARCLPDIGLAGDALRWKPVMGIRALEALSVIAQKPS